MPKSLPQVTSFNHGWVTPRPDGLRARCGGPAVCEICRRERSGSGALVFGTWPTYVIRDGAPDLKLNLRGIAVKGD